MDELQIKRTDVMTGDKNKSRFLYYQLKMSMLRAKKIDIIVSFLMESGVKMILMDLKAALQAENSVSMMTSVYLLCAVPAGRQMSSIPKNQHVQHLLQIRLTLQCRMFLNDVQKGSGLA